MDPFYPWATSLSAFSRQLEQVAPKDNVSPHDFICETKDHGGISSWESLKPKQLQEYYNGKRPGLSKCQVVSLQSLFDKLNGCLSGTVSERGNVIKVAWSKEIKMFATVKLDEDCVYKRENHVGLISILKTGLKILEDIQKAPESLQKMCDRQHANRLREKTSSVWGFIKYFIWSWFYDPRKQIEPLRVKTQALSKEEVIDEAIDRVKKLIIDNMEFFEEVVSDRETAPGIHTSDALSSTSELSLSQPTDVAEKWLKKYAAEPSKSSEEANTYRQNVIIATELWQQIVNLKPAAAQAEVKYASEQRG